MENRSEKKVRLKFKNLHLQPQNDLMNGFPDSYCFKSLQNEFENEKNQVHTRSLHAEENAILQMAKYGGEKLHNGVIYVTASPCELCCKKLYQIGVRKIVYIDEYPGISRENIISIGFHRPHLKQFQGAYGATYFKLYQPLLSYKDELSIRKGGVEKTKIEASDSKGKDGEEINKRLLKEISQRIGIDYHDNIKTEEELVKFMTQFDEWMKNNVKHYETKSLRLELSRTTFHKPNN